MKNLMIVIMFVLGAMNMIWAQTHEGHEHPAANTDAMPQMNQETSAPEAFQVQLAQVFEAYITLKDAFVDSKPAIIKEKAKEVSTRLGKVDMKLLTGQPHMEWMKYLKEMNASLQAISASDNLKDQRKALPGLSTNLYNSIKAFGMKDQSAYYQYCPMANNNKGAFWLSTEKAIRNPYFGAAMLSCGSVKEEL